jgi:hypothetical protein
VYDRGIDFLFCFLVTYYVSYMTKYICTCEHMCDKPKITKNYFKHLGRVRILIFDRMYVQNFYSFLLLSKNMKLKRTLGHIIGIVPPPLSFRQVA